MTINITLAQMGYLVALEEHRHFASAAKACFVTQPTLSMQIQKAEEAIGIKIFDRSRQPVVPSRAGAEVLAQIRTVLRETSRLDEIVGEQQQSVAGSFSLGIIPTLSNTLLPRLVKRILKTHPQVELTIREEVTEALIEQLKSDKLDAALAATPLKDKLIVERPLFYEPFYAYLPNGHSQLKQTHLKLSQLADETLWLLKEGHCFRDQVAELCGKRQKLAVQFDSGNFETLVRLVDQNLGVTILPHLNAHSLSSRSRTRLIGPPTPLREISLICHRQYVRKRIADVISKTVLSSINDTLLIRPKDSVLLSP